MQPNLKWTATAAGLLVLTAFCLAQSRPERGARGGGRSRNPVVRAIDADGDGVLSAQEIAGATAALRALDLNDDGVIGREEMRPARDGPDDVDRRHPEGERPPRSPEEAGERPAVPAAAARPPLTADGLVRIPAGTFEMGDHHDLGGREHRNDEVPVHPVRLDAFCIARTETTARQYAEFLNAAAVQRRIEVRDGLVRRAGGGPAYCDTRASDPAAPVAWDGERSSVLDGRDGHPMVCVRWEGAVAYCNWLSEREGLDLCYDVATGACDFTKSGYRLPTEAEWEYAARGGRHDPYLVYPWGDRVEPARANLPRSGDPFEAGPLPWTTPVGFYDGSLRRKADFGWPGAHDTYQTADGANGYGLYDVAGNVWEWCNDWYDHGYAAGPAVNPRGPAAGRPMRDGKPYHVLRGGNWYNGRDGHARVSNRNPAYYRGPDDPHHSWYAVGFRVARRAAAGATAVAAAPAASTAPAPGNGSAAAAERTVGLMRNAPKACPGYTLFAPKHNHVTYLIDNQGQIVHSWKSEYEPGQSVYLLENGHLLHCCFTRNKGFTRGGEGGRLEEFDWDGNLVWEFAYSSDEHLSHHDIAPLSNGNVLLLAVEKRTYEECLAAGFDPRMLRDRQLFPEHIIEVRPTRPKGGEIVWEWHVWDHLVQDTDPAKANYGKPADHPERVWVNCNGRPVPAFWNHANSIDYSATLDQIVLSVRGCNEIWVIDHSTTTAEAAGHSGGRAGRGGDLLYRWGNPAAYGRGTRDDRQLFQQHDARWIPQGHPGAGNLLIFNNGLDRGWSTLVEIVPPVDAAGRYALDPGKAYGPAKPVWTYQAAQPKDFYSSEISGAHRLPNGNTLACAGVHGTFFEVTPAGETVWRYVNAMVRNGILAQGERPGTDHRGHFWNAVFKIHRYPPDYPGLAGRDLAPRGVIELPASEKGKTGLDGWSERREERDRRPRGEDDRRRPGRGPGGRRDRP